MYPWGRPTGRGSATPHQIRPRARPLFPGKTNVQGWDAPRGGRPRGPRATRAYPSQRRPGSRARRERHGLFFRQPREARGTCWRCSPCPATARVLSLSSWCSRRRLEKTSKARGRFLKVAEKRARRSTTRRVRRPPPWTLHWVRTRRDARLLVREGGPPRRGGDGCSEEKQRSNPRSFSPRLTRHGIFLIFSSSLTRPAHQSIGAPGPCRACGVSTQPRRRLVPPRSALG